jgi:hypothetical protein
VAVVVAVEIIVLVKARLDINLVAALVVVTDKTKAATAAEPEVAVVANLAAQVVLLTAAILVVTAEAMVRTLVHFHLTYLPAMAVEQAELVVTDMPL